MAQKEPPILSARNATLSVALWLYRSTEWAKYYIACCISSIMHQFKEIHLLESLPNFQKDVFY